MKLRRRIIASFLALLLILGPTPGAVGQSGDTQPVSVTVSNQLCAIDLRFTPIVVQSFGTWVWNGTSYEETTGFNSFLFDLYFLNGVWGGCDLLFGFTGLADTSGQHHIAATTSYFDAKEFSGVDTTRHPSGWTDGGVPTNGGAYFFVYTLIAVPSSLPAGTYTGTIKVSVSNAV